MVFPRSAADDSRPAAARKKALRQQLRRRRATRSDPDRQALAARLAAAAHAPPLSSAHSVAAFVGVGDEPDTLPLVEALTRQGVRVLLPVVLPDLDLDWAWFDEAGSLAFTRHGLREPTGPRAGRHAVGAVDVVVVPAFAVDRDGRRLGQGGGCYDRALRRVSPDTPVLAVVFDDEVMTSSLPDEPHDRKVTGRLPN